MTEVWEIYERHARDYDRDRDRRLVERRYLEEITGQLKPGACILDLGCGGGEPIARYFLDKGFNVTGVDAAPALIALCRERFPDARWIVGDMRELNMDQRFDAIIAWDSFFHLDADAQRAMFPVFARHTAPVGLLLFTTGPSAGESIGELYGDPLFHASLDRSEYENLLKQAGFTVLSHKVEDPDCGMHTVWLAESDRRA